MGYRVEFWKHGQWNTFKYRLSASEATLWADAIESLPGGRARVINDDTDQVVY